MNLRFEVAQRAELGAPRRAEILRLCTDAYEEDFTEYLDLLGDSTHLLTFADGTLVSHAAWVTRELRTPGADRPLRAAYVEAVATPSALQGKGFGSATMREIRKHLDGFDIGALSPSEAAFYERFGWELWRGRLSYLQAGNEVATPDEQVMILRLPRTPASLDLDLPLQIDWRPGEVW